MTKKQDGHKEVEVTPMQKPQWIPLPESQSSIYANQVEVRTSNWDVKIRFGEALALEGSEGRVLEKARIVMSPQHTKAFLVVVADAVRKYEAAFGEIHVNPAPKRTEKTQ
jgi:Protein of unknown function (DUF3467)